VNLGGKLGDTDVKVDVQPEEVESADTLQFPSTADTQQNSATGMMSGLTWLALACGLVGIGLGVVALRKHS
jgi:hypothetical protein